MAAFDALLRLPLTLDTAMLRNEGPQRDAGDSDGVWRYRRRWYERREKLVYLRDKIKGDSLRRFAWVSTSPSALKDYVDGSYITCGTCATKLAFRPGYLADLHRHVQPKERKYTASGVLVPTLHEEKELEASERELRKQ